MDFGNTRRYGDFAFKRLRYGREGQCTKDVLRLWVGTRDVRVFVLLEADP